jgi:hypothetical protein
MKSDRRGALPVTLTRRISDGNDLGPRRLNRSGILLEALRSTQVRSDDQRHRYCPSAQLPPPRIGNNLDARSPPRQNAVTIFKIIAILDT